jgi:hypothetical protein
MATLNLRAESDASSIAEQLEDLRACASNHSSSAAAYAALNQHREQARPTSHAPGTRERHGLIDPRRMYSAITSSVTLPLLHTKYSGPPAGDVCAPATFILRLPLNAGRLGNPIVKGPRADFVRSGLQSRAPRGHIRL